MKKRFLYLVTEYDRNDKKTIRLSKLEGEGEEEELREGRGRWKEEIERMLIEMREGIRKEFSVVKEELSEGLKEQKKWMKEEIEGMRKEFRVWEKNGREKGMK